MKKPKVKDKDYEIFITPECMEKLDWITNKYKHEIQVWLGGEINNEQLIIDDLLLSKQTATTGDVEVKGKQLILMRKEYGDRCTRIIGQFHSHINMGCFWSPTDINMQEKFLKNSSKDYAIFIVGSKGEYLTRLALKKPFPVIINDVQLIEISEESEDLENFKKEVKQKVTIRKSTTVYVHGTRKHHKPIEKVVTGAYDYENEWEKEWTEHKQKELEDNARGFYDYFG